MKVDTLSYTAFQYKASFSNSKSSIDIVGTVARENWGEAVDLHTSLF